MSKEAGYNFCKETIGIEAIARKDIINFIQLNSISFFKDVNTSVSKLKQVVYIIEFPEEIKFRKFK